MDERDYKALNSKEYKEGQKQLITEIMNEDAKDGLYDTKKQTAVQTMIKDIEDLITIETYQKWKDIKSKILEMEKEQILEAWDNGWHEHMNPPDLIITSVKYYNKTYSK